MAPRIITDTASFAEQYDLLTAGDILVGRLRMFTGEEHILLDLAARGVTLIPSETSQLCSRSKVFQTRILRKFMVPGTEPVYSMHDILRVISIYARRGVGRVVCKLDRANGGLGVLLFSSIEDVYNQAVLGSLRFPFVVQPYVSDCRDIRVVILSEYYEAYTRYNPDNFRHNLHCGGQSTPWDIDEETLNMCREVMRRAGFPYGSLDLMISPDGEVWLNEINLRGGLAGARITQKDYLEAVDRIHAELLGQAREGKQSDG